MKDSIQELRQDLNRVQTLLSRGAFFSLGPEERGSLSEHARRLLEQLDVLTGSFLTVGLVGGTGVGKSSLMNALAGSQISSTSHRRPHTDLVLIYRHVGAGLPARLGHIRTESGGQDHEYSSGENSGEKPGQPLVSGGADLTPGDFTVAREILHEADAVRQIILCDLPDFDSLVGEHRQRVLNFLEHLDILVWVTSPEKYADGSFYAFLQHVPKAGRNFHFVLNKVDLFFQDAARNHEGYDQLSRVVGRFQKHLSENGVAAPTVLAVSALDALRPSGAAPWNQFSALKLEILRRRDIKEIMAIKTANLDVEIEQLVHRLESEACNLEAFLSALHGLIEDLEKERPEWARGGREAFDASFTDRPDAGSFPRLAEPSAALRGPGYLLAALAQEWRRGSRSSEGRESFSAVLLDDVTVAPLRRHFERMEDRMAYRLLQSGIAPALIDGLEGIMKSPGRWEAAARRLRRFVDVRVASYEPVSEKRFVWTQCGAYFLLLAFFLLALGGEGAWLSLVERPGVSSAFRLILSVMGTLFSPAGLAALGSYTLLNVFLGLGFYGRYKRHLQRCMQKFIGEIRLELGSMWEDELDSLIAGLREYGKEVEKELSAMSELGESRPKS